MEKIIFTRRIAWELRKMGFDIIRVEPNKHKPEFDAYVFEDTQAFEEALSIVMAKR